MNVECGCDYATDQSYFYAKSCTRWWWMLWMLFSFIQQHIHFKINSVSVSYITVEFTHLYLNQYQFNLKSCETSEPNTFSGEKALCRKIISFMWNQIFHLKSKKWWKAHSSAQIANMSSVSGSYFVWPVGCLLFPIAIKH